MGLSKCPLCILTLIYLMHRVLVIATSKKTRGGITSVVKAHERGEQWEEFGCVWIETHRDSCTLVKLLCLLKALWGYVIHLPFCDIVHIHVSEPVSAIRKCPFMWLAKLWRKKTIVHFHSFSPDTTIRGKHKGLYRFIFEKADILIVLSEMWRGYVTECFDINNKIRVLYNPCVAEVSDKVYEKKRQILYAGTLNRRKGYADMIKAFSLIANKYPDWCIALAGNGEMEMGKALAKELKVENEVHFLGWMNGEEKDRIFKESMFFCLPSYAEGFPMAVLDAWAYGLPVITTPVGGIPDIAQNGKNVLLFTPGDVYTLAEKMEKLICDDELRNNMSNQSLHLSATTFNANTINQKLGTIYKQLIEKKKGQGK